VDHDDRTADIGMLGSDTDNPEPGRDTRRTDPGPSRHNRCGPPGDHHGHVRRRP
jgi:hypothetical protein